MAGFWRKCRIAFRCVRITTWLLVLALLGAFLWVNRVGLPDFLKTRLVATLHERGVNLEFSRMRLSLVRGIVAEDVRIGGTGTNYNPSFTASQVQLDLDFPALWHRRLELDGLDLRNGFFSLPLSPTNGLALTNLNTLLRFGTNDTWSLEHFRAYVAGVQIVISGEVAHAREAAEWKLFAGGETNRGVAYEPLKNFADTLDQIHFEGEPQLKLNLSGDARDVHSITLQLNVSAEGVRTPWFSAKNIGAEASLTAPADAPTNSAAFPVFWARLLPFKLTWSAHLNALHSPKLNGDDILCAGVWAAPKLAVSNLSGKLGNGRLAVGAALDVPSRRLTFTNDSNFDPHILAKLLPDAANRQLAQVRWSHAPVLRAEGSVRLPPWNQSFAMNSGSDDLLASLELHGELAFTNAVVQGHPLDRFQTHFSYEDWIVGVTDLTVVQGRTQLHVSGQESEATKNFHVLVNGDLDAASVRSLLTQSNALHGFSLLGFQQPLALSVEATGNLRRLETLTATGRLALADFAIRSQTVDQVAADFSYTNLVVDFLRPQLSRAGGKETFAADKVTLDIAGERLFISGGAGSVEPAVVGRAIGPKTSADMAPYEFLSLPSARVNGCIPLKQKDGDVVTDDADIWFDLTDTVQFRWRKFETPAITGRIHWWKDFIIVTNAVSECYGGEARGWGAFNVSPAINGTDFSFLVNGTNVDLHRMGLALWSPTNRLEGALSGRVSVTQANSEDWRTWNGEGRLQLRDGLLWDVPVIALMSPILNAVSPGLGNSQATEATAEFVMTNGVIHTDSMLIRSTMMRLQYAGTVDLEQNVDARVTAQLLRNTPVVGPVVSAVLWPVSKIFECHVTGTLENPAVKPIYIPKLLLMPLHPIRSLEEWFFPSKATNAPAAN